MEWKQLKMTVNEQQKEQHLKAVEQALESRRVVKFDWAMPLTVLLTAVVLCFLVMAPGLSLQDSDHSQQATPSERKYEKGYVHIWELGKMPSSVLMYGVKRLPEEQLLKLEQWLLTGQTVEVAEPSREPSYEFGLIGEHEKQYVRVYYSSSYNGWLVHLVEENRWLEMEDLDLYELIYDRESHPLKAVGIIVFGLLAFGYMFYVDKVYMKDEEGRKRKSFAKLWHGVVVGSCYIIGIMYLIWVKGAFIPITYVFGLSGILLVAYLDRRNPEFMYRKHLYSAQVLYLLFFITMFSFLNS